MSPPLPPPPGCWLELYAGIGGMRVAATEAGLATQGCLPYEINPSALDAYCHNFPPAAAGPKSRHAPRNLTGLTTAAWDRLQPSVVTLSPPCQPYTRQGHQLGAADPRNASLSHLISVLRDAAHAPRWLLLENVRGFEGQASCEGLRAVLRARGYRVTEYLLCPTQIGVPNARLRYYLLAKRCDKASEPSSEREGSKEIARQFPMCVCLPKEGGIAPHLSKCGVCGRRVNQAATRLLLKHLAPYAGTIEPRGTFSERKNLNAIASDAEKSVCNVELGEYLHSTREAMLKQHNSKNPTEKFLDTFTLKPAQLKKYAYLLDIVDDTSVRTNCFTKNYSRLLEGAGSVFNPSGKSRLNEAFSQGNCHIENGSTSHTTIEGVKPCEALLWSVLSLELRFFTPEEELKLMGFPDWFSFPDSVTVKSRYKLVGNSINVLVVALLMIELFSEGITPDNVH